ncbi:Kinesin-related motor protein [Rhodotorula kratochvilovae]
MASLRRPALASSTAGRRPTASRHAPAPLSSSAASSSATSLTSPPLPGLRGSRDGQDQRSKRETTDGNIQVVVRCRGVSPSERGGSVPVVAEVKATRGTEVKLTDPNPSIPSSANLGTASLSAPTAQTKTWDFGEHPQEAGKEPRGTVYGPDADQGMLYTDVAKPILQQVLQGYNCTIFAYGQTGTGKTYTMEGNLSPYHGTFHPDAGIIPRTLYSLFDRLVESKCEYSVRCSFIELYNEELRDLNSPDAADLSPSSSIAPSPEPGAKPAAAGAKTLRIYEETKNGSTGVLIQGLEETFIGSAEEGLRVLRRGSERRQIAATNCNERSSRSHSIFTINVHIKDNSKEGQDVLKVGKLNLVDLAGSENVGRSGAVQGRAREAGMINASLLALGRVINQLVDKSDSAKKQHIAYRESKLTRLLQDSLGGRTKTTIIATISPVSYEETASTLTYAHQAKSIQNRPEVNQRVSRNVLLNQFATEIERLKADLNAARGNEGVFVSKETWDELEDGRRNYDEKKRKLEIAESQLQTTRDQFEQNFRLLSTREEQLRRTADELAVVKGTLASTSTELEETRLRLAQQEVLRDAFETSREGWKESAAGALDDVEGLRAKLERKSEVERANLAMIADARTAIATRTQEIDERTTQLRTAQDQFVGLLAEQLDEFARRQQGHLASTTELVNKHLSSFATSLAALASSTSTADAQTSSFRQLVESTCSALFRTLSERAASVEAEQRTQSEEVEKRIRAHERAIDTHIDALLAPVHEAKEECAALLGEDARALAALRAADAAALADENARLRTVVARLQAHLAAEEAHLRAEEEAVLARVRAELAAASERRLRSMEEAYGAAKAEVEGVVGAKEEAVHARGEALLGLEERNERVRASVEEMAGACAAGAEEGQKDLASSLALISTGVEGLASTAESAREEQLAHLSRAASFVRVGAVHADRLAHRSRAVTRASLVSVVSLAGETCASWQNSARAAEHDGYSTSLSAAHNLDGYTSLADRCLSSIDAATSSLANKLQQDLQSRVRHDLPTGTTPKARERPQDRLMPTIDLDADRPSVLDRLLAIRAADAAAAAAAAEREREAEDAAAGVSPAADASVRRETPSPVVVRVPLPAPARHSLVHAVSAVPGKEGLLRRAKPPALGERDSNNPARRLGTGVRRVTKTGAGAK